MIVKETDKLLNVDAKIAPRLKFYDSIYNTLSQEKYEPIWMMKLAQMAQLRKTQLSEKSSVQPTSWGITGSHLTKLTDFEKAFTSLLTKPFFTTAEKQKGQNTLESTFSPPTHRIVFVSPLDGKPAIAKAAEILKKAVISKTINEADIDQSLLHALLNSPEGELWPSPELVINFKDVPATAGYPLWQLRYAEIVNAGTLTPGLPLVWKQLHHSFKVFSKTVQRFGK